MQTLFIKKSGIIYAYPVTTSKQQLPYYLFMCLILLSWDCHPQYKLIVAANRDEFYSRPTQPASFWEDHPGILAGRDLQAGGTWLGVHREGYFAAVTNYRDMDTIKANAASRGDLTKDYLINKGKPVHYLREIFERKDEYNDFNLLVSDFQSLYYFSNTRRQIIKLDSGIYGLSNHLLNTPWPKVKIGKQVFSSIIKDKHFSTEPIFELLQNVDTATDKSLPSTGLSPELERAMSSIFIKTPEYGTYCSTVLLVDYEGKCTFEERTFRPNLPSIYKEYSLRMPFEKAT